MQRVEYERLHIIFFECGGYGHWKDNCLKLIMVGQEEVRGDKPQTTR